MILTRSFSPLADSLRDVHPVLRLHVSKHETTVQRSDSQKYP
jgi:hypothetical protein